MFESKSICGQAPLPGRLPVPGDDAHARPSLDTYHATQPPAIPTSILIPSLHPFSLHIIPKGSAASFESSIAQPPDGSIFAI